MALLVFLLGLLPGFAWLVFYLSEDPHPEPKRMILLTFVAGMAFGFFTVAMESIFITGSARYFGVAELSFLSLIGLALIEEVMKFTAAHFVMNISPSIDEPIDAMIYMVVAALGFATLENIGSIVAIPVGAGFFAGVFQTITLRFVGATLLHSLTSGIVGYYWAKGIARGRMGTMIAHGLAIAVIVHTLFNYLILNNSNLGFSVLFLIVVGWFVMNDFERLKGPARIVETQ